MFRGAAVVTFFIGKSAGILWCSGLVCDYRAAASVVHLVWFFTMTNVHTQGFECMARGTQIIVIIIYYIDLHPQKLNRFWGGGGWGGGGGGGKLWT